MAFTFEDFTVTFTIKGAFDGSRQKVVEFSPAGVDMAAKRLQLDTDIATWRTNWNADNALTSGVSSSWLSGYVISEGYAEGDSIPAFTGAENVYQEAQLQAVLDGANDKFSTYIASPDARIFVGDSVNTKQIDTADADYQAYGAMYVAGAICTISNGDQFQTPLNVVGSGLRTVRSGKSY
jgi:hypothetical protein